MPTWMPPNINRIKAKKIKIKLLCGSDMLKSIADQIAWPADDVNSMNVSRYLNMFANIIILSYRFDILLKNMVLL